jgi:hypothetical protein
MVEVLECSPDLLLKNPRFHSHTKGQIAPPLCKTHQKSSVKTPRVLRHGRLPSSATSLPRYLNSVHHRSNWNTFCQEHHFLAQANLLNPLPLPTTFGRIPTLSQTAVLRPIDCRWGDLTPTHFALRPRCTPLFHNKQFIVGVPVIKMAVKI